MALRRSRIKQPWKQLVGKRDREMKNNISCQLPLLCRPARFMQEESVCSEVSTNPTQNAGTSQGEYPEGRAASFVPNLKFEYYQNYSPMSLKPLSHDPGAVYHVILHGKAGGPIFLKDSERYRYYLLMLEAVRQFNCQIHSFCFATNHIHLVVQVVDMPLVKIIRSLSQKYNEWINCTRRRTGNLFQGNYKAIILEPDAYLGESYS
jgi:REP element-mobilizing transposase RayT